MAWGLPGHQTLQKQKRQPWRNPAHRTWSYQGRRTLLMSGTDSNRSTDTTTMRPTPLSMGGVGPTTILRGAGDHSSHGGNGSSSHDGEGSSSHTGGGSSSHNGDSSPPAGVTPGRSPPREVVEFAATSAAAR